MTINKYGIRVIDEAEQLEGYETFEGSDDIRGNFVRVSTGGLIDGFSTIVEIKDDEFFETVHSIFSCLLYTSPSPRDRQKSRMPSSA